MLDNTDYEELKNYKILMKGLVNTVFGPEGTYVTITEAKRRFYKYASMVGGKPYAKDNKMVSEIVFYALWDIYYAGVLTGSVKYSETKSS